jgi:uncharacterized protein with PIN domain
MKQVLEEMKLSMPFRTICSQCKKELNFNDRKYTDSSIRPMYNRYYCEECKNQSGVRRIS